MRSKSLIRTKNYKFEQYVQNKKLASGINYVTYLSATIAKNNIQVV